MQHQKQLHQHAKEDLWYLFTGEQIARMCNVSQNVISRIKGLADSPFFMNKGRPEWVVDWMRLHTGFRLTKTGDPKADIQKRNSPVNSKSSGAQSKKVKLRKRRSKRRAIRKP